MTPRRRMKMDPFGFSFKLGGMINVEDWAEIRRLHRAEGVAIK